MTTEAEVTAWMEGYLAAWTTNDPADIGALFTDEAVYYTRPYGGAVFQGTDGIVAGWLEHLDESGTWTFDWHLLGIAGDRVFVRGVTEYTGIPDYDNLWVITLTDDGRASEFTEWAVARE